MWRFDPRPSESRIWLAGASVLRAAAKAVRRLAAPVAFGACALALGASCSPGSLSGGTDHHVRRQTRYRAPHGDCSGLRLERPALDPATFRGLVACLNATGRIDPYEKLLERLSDQDLGSVLDWVNAAWLTQPERLGESIESFRSLQSAGALREVFEPLGWALGQEESFLTTLSLLREMVEAEPKLALGALERMAEALEPQATAELLGAAIGVSGSRTFGSFFRNWLGSGESGGVGTGAGGAGSFWGGKRNDWLPGALEYLRSGFPFAERMREAGLTARVLPALDAYFLSSVSGFSAPPSASASLSAPRSAQAGADRSRPVGTFGLDELRRTVPPLALMLDTVSRRLLTPSVGAPFGALLGEIHQLARAVETPVACLGEPRVAEGALFLMRESLRVGAQGTEALREFLLRDVPLLLAATSGVCALPQEISRHYGAIRRVALSPALEAVTPLFRALESQGLLPLLPKILADPALPAILPLLAELSEREAWPDLLLLLQLPRPEDRPALERALVFMTDPSARLGGGSLVGALRTLSAAPSLASWARWLAANRSLLAADLVLGEGGGVRLSRFLEGLRVVHASSPRFPLLAAARELLSTASKKESAVRALLSLSDTPELADALKLTARMSADGSLPELIERTLVLFERFSAKANPGPFLAVGLGSGTRLAIRPKATRPWRRHDWSASDLGSTLFGWEETQITPSNRVSPCERLDLASSVFGFDDGKSENPLSAFLSCFAGEAGGEGVPTAGYSLAETLEQLRYSRVRNGKSFLDFVFGLGTDLGTTLKAAGNWAAFGNSAVGAIENRTWHRVAELVPLVTTGYDGAWQSSVLESALRANTILRQRAPEALATTWATASRALRSEQLSVALQELVRIQRIREGESEEITEDRGIDWRRAALGLDRPEVSANLDALVRTRECVADPAIRARRVEEIRLDFLESRSNLVPGRTGLGISDLRRELGPLFAKFADPTQNSEGRSSTQALVNVLRYFSLPLDPAIAVDAEDPRRERGRHYTAEYLARWLRERSSDYRPISYFYPGEMRPRVRLINTLDALELILASANLTYVLPDNFAMKFLAEIGEAWGDEPERLWPAEIRAKYRRRGRPATLREAYEKIMRTARSLRATVGFPKLPRCKELGPEPEIPGVVKADPVRRVPVPLHVRASVYNALQVLPAVADNLPGAPGPAAGGMKVLRDLFFELYYSTPEKDRNPRSGLRNNLHVISHLIDAGLMRHIGRQLGKFPALGADPGQYLAARRLDARSAGPGSAVLETRVLVDLFRGLIAGASATSASRLLEAVFRRDPEHRLAWVFLERLLEVGDSSRSAAAGLRGAGLHLFAQLSRLGDLSPIVEGAAVLLERHSEYLASRPERLEAALRSDVLQGWVRDVYGLASREGESAFRGVLQAVVADPGALAAAVGLARALDEFHGEDGKTALSQLSERIERLRGNGNWERLRAGELVWDLAAFLGESPGGRTLLPWLGERLPEDGDALSQWFAENPELARQLFQALAGTVHDGTLQGGLELVGRAL